MAEPVKKRKRGLFFWLAWSTVALTLGGIAAIFGVYAYMAQDLPPLYSLRSYRPLVMTEIYSDDGTLIAEFAEQRRKVVPADEIPLVVKNAFVSTEDRRFYQHRGLDGRGITRVIFCRLTGGSNCGGASTITQQVARTFFLSYEQTLTRKMKEQILALQMENYLTKDEILYLYLNQIDLGRGLYGVGAACEYYFGQPIQKITLAEAAMLAGMPPAPSRYNPVSSWSKAKWRQKHVLRVMTEEKYITPEEAETAYKEPIKVVAKYGPNGEAAPYFVEHVRRLLAERYGWQTVYREGLKVFTTVNLKADQIAREVALKHIVGKGGVERNLGYFGPQPGGPLKGDTAERWVVEEETRHRKSWLRANWRKVLANGLADEIKAEDLEKSAPDPAPLEVGEQYNALVSLVDDDKGEVHIRVGKQRGKLLKKEMSWAAPYNSKARPPVKLGKPSDILKKGDIILVRVTSEKDGTYSFSLEQEAVIQAGVYAISTRNGHVKTLMGGLSGEYIRPIQALRQPGSSFKPFVYATAFDADPPGLYTPATVVIDAPIIFDEDTRNNACVEEMAGWQRYSPRNYDGSFHGPMSLRQALAKSVNTIAVRLAWSCCIKNVMLKAQALGITTELDPYPCLALGCSEVTLEEMTTAFAVFANGGYKLTPIYITRVYDREGNLLEYEERNPKLIYDPVVEKWAMGEVPGSEFLAGDTAGGLVEEDITDDTPPPPVLTASTHHYLAQPVPPLQIKEPTWEEYLGDLRVGKEDWLAPPNVAPRGQPVLSPPTAYLMTSMLQSVIAEGTGTKAQALGRPVGGKTGTTNDYKDAWFVGFSPELAVGAWVGADNYSIALGRGVTGGAAALPIWVDYMKVALADRPKYEFQMPPGIETVKICTETGLTANEFCPSVRGEIFKRGTVPPRCNHSAYFDPLRPGSQGDPLMQLE